MSALLIIWAAAARAQQAPVWREFSIGKPLPKAGGQFTANSVRADALTLRHAVALAYIVPEYRVTGPAWIGVDRFAVTAMADSPADFQQLFQKELADRFQLKVRRETRQVRTLVVRRAGGEVKLARPSSPRNEFTISSDSEGGHSIRATRMNLHDFAERLSDMTGWPAVDATGLEGDFAIELKWKGAQTSLDEALGAVGLQLSEEQRPLEFLVVENAARPNLD